MKKERRKEKEKRALEENLQDQACGAID